MNLKCIDGPLKGKTFACAYNSIFREHVTRVRYNWFVENGEVVLKFDPNR